VADALDALGLGAGDRVLDVGCGAGELLVGFALVVRRSASRTP
jgi:cyclopropane fatty-acyl-phospholipid synthase-like methyltransferase